MHEVAKQLQPIARAVAVDFDRLDFSRDGIGDIHHIGVGLGPGGFVRKGEAAQAGAAHFEIGRGPGKLRCIALELRIGAAGIIRVSVEGHRRIAVIIRLLNPHLAFAVDHQSPDIARSLAGDLEVAAVVAEASHAGLIELLLLAVGRAHLAVVERPLRHPNPVAGRARELVR